MSDAATRAATPVTTILNGATAEIVRALAGMFRMTAPVSHEGVLHRVLLAAVLCVGSVLRFWGLGNHGLHGDEETMAMAVMHIVQDGRPILPSGMFYPRGLTELYLMAASVQIFGESEWAFRLPSALCGVALIALSYLAGRRFLRPQWNLALTATVALLPELIEYSQTARMYIFMLACIAGCLVCIFAWERSDRIGWLIGAVLAIIVGIELHALAVTCALLFLFPGLLQGNQRKFAYGIGAAAIVMVAYVAVDAWVNANYPVPPPEYAAEVATVVRRGGAVMQNDLLQFDIALWVTGAVTAFLAVHLGRVARQPLPAFCATALLLAALIAQLALFYHVAVLLAVAGSVVAYRYRITPAASRFWRYAIASALIALIHVTLLAARPGSVVKLVGALVGQPSVWPYVRVADFSIAAAAFTILATAWGLWRIANRRRAPDYWLLAMLGVWIPVFALGFFLWNMPARYTSASLLPMLLCSFAFAQYCADRLWARLNLGSAARPTQNLAILAVVVVAVNPATTIAAIAAGGSQYPDHKGAARFVRAQQLRPDDIVLAEDVLQQTYYLGHVDYWLIGRRHARRFVQHVNGEIRDFYTGTRVIDDGTQLRELLDRARDRRVFIIGSGEDQSDRRRGVRGVSISQVLASDLVETIYLGRDGLTKVWRPRPSPPAAPAVSSFKRPAASHRG